MNDHDNIYYEYLSLVKKYLYYRIQYILNKKFPFLFENSDKINEDIYIKAKSNYEDFEKVNKMILDRYYLIRLKKRIPVFEFEFLMLLFFNIEDLKFNALIKKIKDPDRIPLSDDDYYEINLNEALELIILDEKEKFIIRKNFLLSSYLLEHKIVSFIFSENIFDNPFIYNENIKLNTYIVNKLMCIEIQHKKIDHSLPYYNRLKISEDGY